VTSGPIAIRDAVRSALAPKSGATTSEKLGHSAAALLAVLCAAFFRAFEVNRDTATIWWL
jgi:hypothetical protein